MFDLSKVNTIKGYETITVNNLMFEKFLVNFFNSWGVEARETIQPLKVSYVREKGKHTYLKFTYKIYGRKEWLHVTSSTCWW